MFHFFRSTLQLLSAGVLVWTLPLKCLVGRNLLLKGLCGGADLPVKIRRGGEYYYWRIMNVPPLMKKYFVKMFLACYDPNPAIKILPLGIAENFTWHQLGTIFGACWMFCCQFHRLCCRWPEVDWRTWSYFLAALNTCGTVWPAYQAADKTLASLVSRDLGSLLLLMSRSKELCFLLLLL